MDNNEILPVHRTGIFATLIIATFVTSMSTTVTANMIPNFTEYFGVSANLAQWLTSGATLISGIIIPVTAFLLKKVPNRIYFFATMLAYTLGSLFSFLAPTFPVLLVSRLIQAVGRGMMIPFGQIMLLNLYPAEKHGRVMAAFSMASMVSTVVGPTYAGLMLEAVGWRGVCLFVCVWICDYCVWKYFYEKCYSVVRSRIKCRLCASFCHRFCLFADRCEQYEQWLSSEADEWRVNVNRCHFPLHIFKTAAYFKEADAESEGI